MVNTRANTMESKMDATKVRKNVAKAERDAVEAQNKLPRPEILSWRS